MSGLFQAISDRIDVIKRWYVPCVLPSPESRYEELRRGFLREAAQVAPDVKWSVGEQTAGLVAKRLLCVYCTLYEEKTIALGLRSFVSFAEVEHEPEAVALGIARHLMAYVEGNLPKEDEYTRCCVDIGVVIEGFVLY